MMHTWRLLLLLFFAGHYSCAQVSQVPAGDSLNIQPGVIVVTGSITAVSKNTVTLSIHEVVGTGQGIINMLSAGQKTPVLMGTGVRLRPGEKIRAHLKEKLEADASRSSYELVQLKKLKP